MLSSLVMLCGFFEIASELGSLYMGTQRRLQWYTVHLCPAPAVQRMRIFPHQHPSTDFIYGSLIIPFHFDPFCRPLISLHYTYLP